MITLAFYHGRGQTPMARALDTAIRAATGGRFSHVELVGGVAYYGDTAPCLSASGRDRGVRKKMILLSADRWELVHLDIDPTRPMQFIEERIGAGYDYLGIALSQFLAVACHEKSRWFCSEIVAAALDLPNPQRLSPQLLYDVVTWGRG